MSPSSLAVLVSGGLDSAVLLAEAGRDRTLVVPIYIRSGLVWEAAEIAHLQQFLSAVATPAIRSLVTLDLPVSDLYDQAHWSLTANGAPDRQSPDSAVYLPGRNVILLAKALVWCHLHEIGSLALAVLAGNPFPDATPEFFGLMAETVNRAVSGSIRIETPFAALSKVDVLRRGRELPLALTFSCIAPMNGRHCGRCNKCAERQRAFATAGLADPTNYA